MDYKGLYNLKESPFNLTPDPDFFFPSKTHKIALETLLYSIKSKEGFIQITGKPGTGKSMLLRKILRQIEDSVVICLLLHTNIKADSLLGVIMEDLKIDTSTLKNHNKENLISLFKEFLLEQIQVGKHVIIIADEAQNMPDETLEELRMLSNLETEKTKLLQIILVGQIELETRISPTRLSQLYQRITIRYRLNSLTKKETEAYILHRLKIASMDGKTNLVKFKTGVINQIYKFSKGVPRLINIISERALMASFIDNSEQITKKHIKKGLVSIQGEIKTESNTNGLITFCYICIFLIIVAGLWGYGKLNPSFDPFSIKSSANQIQSSSLPQVTKPVIKTIKEPSPEKLAFNWIDFPEKGGQIAILNKETKKLSLWCKNNNIITKINEKSMEITIPSGIYMAGTDKNKNQFIFNPEISYLMPDALDDLSENEFLPFINSNNPSRVTPIIIINTLDDIKNKKNTNKVKTALNLWADAWKNLNLDDFIKSFGNRISIYETDEKQPVTFSINDIIKQKKNIFVKSEYVNLKIYNTLCMLDPLNDNRAYAVFSQEYSSKIHQDNGEKILYFQKIFSQDGSFDWKIIGKLWIES